jgi:hypothetical protein
MISRVSEAVTLLAQLNWAKETRSTPNTPLDTERVGDGRGTDETLREVAVALRDRRHVRHYRVSAHLAETFVGRKEERLPLASGLGHSQPQPDSFTSGSSLRCHTLFHHLPFQLLVD